jgi:MFS superfamily sulfate permease-like transporter
MARAPKTNNYIRHLPYDSTSAIVVFLVALPLCLGVALASNAPLFSGLIAGVVGGVVVGLASRSHLSVSGPAAGLTAIVAASLALLPSFEAFLLSVMLAGLLQIAFGFAKAGVLGDYIPGSVIKGMLAAIGVILILNQIPHLMGDDSLFEIDEDTPRKGNLFVNAFNALGNPDAAALSIGIIGISILILWERLQKGKTNWIRFMPGALITVIAGMLLNGLFIRTGWVDPLQGEHLVMLPEANSAVEFFSFFTQPDWSQWNNQQVWITATTLAVVASIESLLSVEAVDELDPYQRVTPTNRELKAQGIGNVVSGLLGGLPVTSVIVRSSANVNAGARTKSSTMLHGLLLLLSVALIPYVLNLIPKSSLAAILLFTGYKLTKPSLFKFYYKKGWNQFLPLVITILAIVFTDLLKGVMIGIGIGLLFILRSNFRPASMVTSSGNNYLVRFRRDASFLNKPIIKRQLEGIPEGSSVLIDISRADFIDPDVIEIVEDFQKSAPLKNIRVEIKQNIFGKKAIQTPEA